MQKYLIECVLIAWCVFLNSNSCWADETQRIALVVGANQGAKKDVDLLYAESDALRFSDVLKEIGSFDRVDVMRAPSAAQLAQELTEMTKDIKELKKMGKQVFFLFFYSGHGDEGGLHLGETVMSSEDLLDLLSRSEADLRIAIIDSCQSGAMIREKGLVGKKAPAEVKYVDELEIKGQAVLASTSQGESAQESEQFRGSFFSTYLVSGLRGAADTNRDGAISLTEAYLYAFNRTVYSTVVSAAGAQHPTYNMKLTGKKDVTLTWPMRGSAILNLRTTVAGRFIVFREKDNAVMAEVTASSKDSASITLPKGKYIVKKRAAKGLLVANVLLDDGDERTVAEANMEMTPYIQVAYKGVSDAPDLPISTYRSGPLRGWSLTLGALGIASLTTGVILEVLAYREKNKYEKMLSDNRRSVETNNLSGNTTSYDDIQDKVNRAKSEALGGHIALGAGAALATSAVITMLIWRKNLHKESASIFGFKLTPYSQANNYGLMLSAEF